jgi:hypothetical protein
MKAHTYFTPSHRIFYDDFLKPSFPKTHELIVHEYEQICQEKGRWRSPGFYKTVCKKVELLRDLAADPNEDMFLFMDSDVQFFNEDTVTDFIEYSKFSVFDDVHFWCMDDIMPCTGFMYVRCNSTTVKVFDEMIELMKRNDSKSLGGDQNAFRFVTNNHQDFQGRIITSLLPRLIYCNYAHLETLNQGGKKDHYVWDGQTPVEVPNDVIDAMRVHHGNYTIGVDNKFALMSTVREQVKARKESNQ